MTIPSQITQGDSVVWRDDAFVDAGGRTLTSADWTLTYSIAGPISSPVTLVGVPNGPGWKIALDATTSATLVAGQYWWSAVLTAGGERLTARRGSLQVLASLSNQINYDGRTQAQRDLAAVDAAIAARIEGGLVTDYTIGSRSLKKEPMSALLALRSQLIIRVRNEQAASDIANGLGDPRNLFARFN